MTNELSIQQVVNVFGFFETLANSQSLCLCFVCFEKVTPTFQIVFKPLFNEMITL